jgi:hypothetical protein
MYCTAVKLCRCITHQLQPIGWLQGRSELKGHTSAGGSAVVFVCLIYDAPVQLLGSTCRCLVSPRPLGLCDVANLYVS